MYDTARKIEDNLEIYWCLSGNDKKVTNFRKELQCVEDGGLYLVLVSFATRVHGCRRECGATDLCWREGGREGGRGGSGHSYSQPKILRLSHILSPARSPVCRATAKLILDRDPPPPVLKSSTRPIVHPP